MKKYELVTVEDDTLQSTTLAIPMPPAQRIIALRDIPRHGVKVGDLGGLVTDEDSLDQDGDAWVTEHARVMGDARVAGNALVTDEALVSDEALIDGNSVISGHARIGGSSFITDEVRIGGEARLIGNMAITGKSRVGGKDNIYVPPASEALFKEYHHRTHRRWITPDILS